MGVLYFVNFSFSLDSLLLRDMCIWFLFIFIVFFLLKLLGGLRLCDSLIEE